ncbi:MAG: hypothetical protein ABIG66_05580 [Candidatus Kerfeldbacteria bacterium]
MFAAQLRSKLLQRFEEFRACGAARHFMRQDLQARGAVHFLTQVRRTCRTMSGDPHEQRFRRLMAELLADCIEIGVVDARDAQWQRIIIRATTMQAMRRLTSGRRPDLVEEGKDVINRYRKWLAYAPHRVRDLEGVDLVDVPPGLFLDMLLWTLQRPAS